MRKERQEHINELVNLGYSYRYAISATYVAFLDPCPLCGNVHNNRPKTIEKKKYSGIDEEGDDLEDWNWNYINNRCVWSRRLKQTEVDKLGL